MHACVCVCVFVNENAFVTVIQVINWWVNLDKINYSPTKTESRNWLLYYWTELVITIISFRFFIKMKPNGSSVIFHPVF